MHNIENFSKAKNTGKTSSEYKKHLEFKEILCPKNNSRLVVSNCFKCQDRQKIKSTHKSKRTLTSLICLYGTKSDGGFE